MFNQLLQNDASFPVSLKSLRLMESAVQKRERQLLAFQLQLERPKREISRLRSLITPIHCLPNDVLSDLFALITLSSFEWIENDPSVQLSQVCRRWREVALSTPALWTRIRVSYRDGSKDPSHRINLSLSRSMNLPIIIYQNVTVELGRPGTQAYTLVFSIVRILRPSSNRWKAATIVIRHVSVDSPLLSLLCVANLTSWNTLTWTGNPYQCRRIRKALKKTSNSLIFSMRRLCTLSISNAGKAVSFTFPLPGRPWRRLRLGMPSPKTLCETS